VARNLLDRIPAVVRRQGSSPAHAQIEQWLMDSIADGELSPGDRLPGERDLAAALGVSRMTLRHALAGLERGGVLVRRPGRTGGAFVAEPKIDCDLTGLAGFTEQMRRAHRQAGARVLTAHTVGAAPAVAAALRMSAGTEVHEIVRIRSANQVALAIEQSFFPAEHFPDLLEHPLTGSLYGLLERHYVHHPHTATEYLEPVTATAEDAAALEIAPGTALMRVERTAGSVAGLPVEYARDLYRADRVRMMIRTGVSAEVAAGAATSLQVVVNP
jgi:GntR family transcriptional regulator